MMEIYFVFEKRTYRVSRRAYELGKILLPDGRLFDVIWDESGDNPRVRSLSQVRNSYAIASLAVANATRSVLAERI